MTRVLLDAEVRRLEQLLDEDDLRALLRRLPHQPLGRGDVRVDIPAAGELGAATVTCRGVHDADAAGLDPREPVVRHFGIMRDREQRHHRGLAGCALSRPVPRELVTLGLTAVAGADPAAAGHLRRRTGLSGRLPARSDR